MVAVIESGSKQYLVEKGQTIEVELLTNKAMVEFKPLLIIDGDRVHIGKPFLENALVKAKVESEPAAGTKLTILKYKPKKRYSKKTGHRQRYSKLTISEIKAKT